MKSSVIALALLGLATASPAAANLFTISGSGIWAGNAPITAYSAPGDSYSFTFQIEQTYLASYVEPHLKQTVSFQANHYKAYEYKLNGSNVVGAPLNITFFDATLSGGLALSYADHSVELIGPDIASSGAVFPTHSTTFYPNIDYVSDPDGAINQGTAAINAVPEPATWALSLVGFGLAGGMFRRRRAGVSAAA